MELTKSESNLLEILLEADKPLSKSEILDHASADKPWKDGSKIINIHHIYQPVKKFLFFKIGNRLFVYQLLLLVWGIGTLSLLFYYLYSSLLEIYKLNHLNYISSPDIETLCSNYTNIKIVIKVSSEIDVPLVWGFFKCHIYFPNYDLSSDEWKFILDHEVLHIKLHDTFIKIFLLFLTALFWWNPIMYILRKDPTQLKNRSKRRYI